MSEPSRAIHLRRPWGAYPPSLGFRLVLWLAWRTPTVPVIKQLVYLLRRIGRAIRTDPVDIVLWGHRLRLFPHGNISEGRILFMPTRWDPRERRILADEARALGEMTFVDVGANAGGYVWWVRSVLGDRARILALEPDPELHRGLLFNLETNGAQNVEVLQVAVATSEGEGVLRIDPENRGASELLEAGAALPDARGVTVPVRPLADVVREVGFSRVDAMKVDIEGLERPVLNQFFRSVERPLWPRLLIMERKDTADHAAMEAELVERGYDVVARGPLNVVCRLGDRAAPSLRGPR